MRLQSASHARGLWLFLATAGLLVGCETKPATQNAGQQAAQPSPVAGPTGSAAVESTHSATPGGELAVAPVIAPDGTEIAPVVESPASGSAANADPENPRDANDDGLPDDAHVFDIPAGDNATLLRFIAEAPGRMLSPDDEETGGQAIVLAAEKVLKNKPTVEQRRAAAEAMFTWLERLDAYYVREASKVRTYWKSRLAEFEQIDDADLAALVARSRLLRRALDWNQLRPDERDEYLDQLPDYFAGRRLDEDDLDLAQRLATSVLNAGDRASAIVVYNQLAEILARSNQEEIAAEGAKLGGMAYRLESLGQEIDFAATRLDGQPLDWESYRGQVVLIDFWATWCGPCLAELPHIRELYERYHQRGFDVIGVSVDRDQDALQAFVEKNKLPWAVTFHTDEAELGLAQPLAVQFGVSTVPVALLVDQEGRLISLDARGDELRTWLERLLGPAELGPESETPAEEKPPQAEESPEAEKPPTDEAE